MTRDRCYTRAGAARFPVGLGSAATASDAYQRGSVVPDRYRGRAGQPREAQEAEYARLADGGALPLGFS